MPTAAYISTVGSYQPCHKKIFQELGVDVVNLIDVLGVRNELTNRKFDMILMSIDLPVSEAGKTTPDEPELNALEAEIEKSGMWNGGLYAIRQIRKEGSANRDTPIIVADVYAPSGDALFPDAEQQVLGAGATAYCDDIRPITLRELVSSQLRQQ